MGRAFEPVGVTGFGGRRLVESPAGAVMVAVNVKVARPAQCCQRKQWA